MRPQHLASNHSEIPLSCTSQAQYAVTEASSAATFKQGVACYGAASPATQHTEPRASVPYLWMAEEAARRSRDLGAGGKQQNSRHKGWPWQCCL